MNPRLRRLQADFELVRDVFSGHPHVRADPVGTRLPPETYRIQYRLRGLRLNGEQPEYVETHTVELMLPRRYPAEKPYAVPVTPVFHPNIREYFCIADYWAAGTTLVDVISKMGDMIQWRIYNVASPLDGIAARWAAQNEDTGILPVGNVDMGVAEIDVAVKPRGTEAPAPSSPIAEPEPASESDADLPLATGAEAPTTIAAPRAEDDFVVTLKRN